MLLAQCIAFRSSLMHLLIDKELRQFHGYSFHLLLLDKSLTVCVVYTFFFAYYVEWGVKVNTFDYSPNLSNRYISRKLPEITVKCSPKVVRKERALALSTPRDSTTIG